MTAPDMFSLPKPTKPKKEKEKPEASRAQQMACVSGLIAGMPASFATALEALRDIDRRATETNALAGILTPAQATVVLGVKLEIKGVIAEVECQWRKIEEVIDRTPAINEEVDLL